jgi:hypothetical protein
MIYGGKFWNVLTTSKSIFRNRSIYSRRPKPHTFYPAEELHPSETQCYSYKNQYSTNLDHNEATPYAVKLVQFWYMLLQFLNLDRKNAWAAFCPHKGLFVEALIFLRELVFMVLTRERIICASICLCSAWMRGRLRALRTVTGAFWVIINFACWTCIVRVFQPFSRCNRAEQLIPPRQSLSFLLLPSCCLSLFFLFIICLPGSITKVKNIILHQLTVRAFHTQKKSVSELALKLCMFTTIMKGHYWFIKILPFILLHLHDNRIDSSNHLKVSSIQHTSKMAFLNSSHTTIPSKTGTHRPLR